MVEFPIPIPSPPNTKSTGGPARIEPVTPTLPNVPANLPTPGPPAVILVRSKKKSARDDAPQTKPISIAPIEVNRFMIATLMSELLEAQGPIRLFKLPKFVSFFKEIPISSRIVLKTCPPASDFQLPSLQE